MSELKLEIKNQQLFDVAKKNFPVVAVRSLKKAVAQTKTQASKAIRDVYNLKKSDVDPALKLRIDPAGFSAAIVATGRRFTLGRFGARATRQGVRVQIKRKGTKYIKSGFMGSAPGGNSLAWMRTGESKVIPQKGRYLGRIAKRGLNKGMAIRREPLKVLRTISVARMFGARAVRLPLAKFFQEKLSEIVRHELKFYLFKKT